MKNNYWIAALLLLAPVVAFAGKWYEGGTLYSASVKQWHQASPHNQLATAGDIVSNVNKPSSMRQAKRRAIKERGCINEATADMKQSDQDVSQFAAACIVLLGYK